MEAPDDIQAEMGVLQDLADDSDRMWQAATSAQLGRICEIVRRVLAENPPGLVRVRAIAVLYGYRFDRFRTTEQLSIQNAGAFITWAFVSHKADADLDTVPLREGASRTIRWAVDAARSGISAAEIAEDEERRKAQQRRRKERCARKKRETASVSRQGQPVAA